MGGLDAVLFGFDVAVNEPPANPNDNGCFSFVGVNAVTGRTLFQEPPSALGISDYSCQGNSFALDSFGDGQAIFSDGGGDVGVFWEQTGQAVSGAPRIVVPQNSDFSQGSAFDIDGSDGLVAIYQGSGAISVYDWNGWREVGGMSASTANAVSAGVQGICDGDLFLVTDTQRIVVKATDNAVLAESWGVGPIECGRGWALVGTYDDGVGAPFYLVRGPGSLVNNLSQIPGGT
jgi:hypothetical protein